MQQTEQIPLDNAYTLTHNRTMNRLSNEQRTAVVNCLIEGCSIRSTVRMTGVAKKTVMRLLVEVGAFCSEYQDRVFRNLKCQRLQGEREKRHRDHCSKESSGRRCL